MKKTFNFILVLFLVLSSLVLIGCEKTTNEYDDNGNMILNLRNLYFNDWTGSDAYTSYIENKFGVSIRATSYSWADWDQQVIAPIQSGNLTDVIHFDVDSYNAANTYYFWAEDEDIKALPSDLSRWPNLKQVIENVSNIDSFYIDGKLYCIPITKNINEAEINYSPFTYVYRRDWAIELGVYQEDDVYTWDQFKALVKKFYEEKSVPNGEDIAAIADVEWGFPSVINLYKTAPHCFTNDDGQVVSNYTTEEFLTGLDFAKSWVSNKYYTLDQFTLNDGDAAKMYYAGKVGVYYENLSLSNYSTLREEVSKRTEIVTEQQLDDATAILKVSGPDSKYALEGGENWFSVTMFNADISDEKMEKILDIMDWLLSEEGTMMAIYGIEDYDYEVDGAGNVTLLEAGWEKDMDGNYVEKMNGAKYLRYMVTLGYDTSEKDPLVDQKALSILNDWYDFMDAQKAGGNLRVLAEDGNVKWLNTPLKSEKSGKLLSDANTAINNYVYSRSTKNEFIELFTSSTWVNVLNEINSNVNK